jgi:hypothetical protein
MSDRALSNSMHVFAEYPSACVTVYDIVILGDLCILVRLREVDNKFSKLPEVSVPSLRVSQMDYSVLAVVILSLQPS